MRTGDWVDPPLRGAPRCLRSAIVAATRGLDEDRRDSEDLMQAAVHLLDAIGHDRADRGAAIQLLAADALATLACELKIARQAREER